MPDLWIAPALVEQMLALPARPYEIGGWLLGYWTADRSSVAVTAGTPPGRRGTPFGITIDGRHHRRRFDEAWQGSGGLVTFVGDWHSHPGGPSVPSRRDERAARLVAVDPDFGTPQPILAIVSLPRLPPRRRPRDVRWFVGDVEEELCPLAPKSMRSLPSAAASVPEWPWPRTRHV